MKHKRNDLLGKRIAVISDIHSNNDSLKCAIEIIRKKKVDVIIILGDLLTYGCQVNESVEELLMLKKEYPCLFIIGNHDEFYFNLSENKAHENYSVPMFIEESINWNFEQLKYNLKEVFTWYESINVGPVLFAHANPYEFKDWSYINSEVDILNAVDALDKGSYSIGVFGHTHRPMSKSVSLVDKKVFDVSEEFNHSTGEHLILNPGSLGQPRGDGASFLIMEINSDNTKYEHVKISYEKHDFLSLFSESGMTTSTIRKLKKYYE